MSEDATFLRLRQISYEGLADLLNHMTQEEFDLLVKDKAAKEMYLNKCGWTSDEFDAQCWIRYT